MAHGLESRVPFLDHPLVEFAATILGREIQERLDENVLRMGSANNSPTVLNRKDKMGFPVPLTEWFKNEARDFVVDTLSTKAASQRDLIDNKIVLSKLESEPQFSRKLWGMLSLELWQQEFHDRASYFRSLVEPVQRPARRAA